MKIRRIDILNYRGIRECHLDLSGTSDVAILAGLNGSGKSSVIEATRFALGQLYGLRPIPAYSFRVQVRCETSRGEWYTVEATESMRTLTESNGTVHQQLLPEDFTRFELVSNWFFTSWRDPVLSPDVDLQEPKNFEALRTNRTKEFTFEMIRDFLVRCSVQANYNQNQSEIDGVSALYSRLAEAWNLFYPHNPADFVTRAVGNVLAANGFSAPTGTSRMPFGLYLRRRLDQKMLSVDDLSSGELELFCFLGVLISTIPTLDIVYIDEPELHLNQQWHILLMHALRVVSPNTQFIVATHSADIWNSVLSTQRFFVDFGRVTNINEGS